MNLLDQLKQATQIFLEHAYPKGAPKRILELQEQLNYLTNDHELLDWHALEKENSRYHLRLGNASYPHMKLVFLVDSGQPIFYVDAHDAHFTLPPGIPGHEKLLVLREENKRMKQLVESAMAEKNLVIFGRLVQSMPAKRLCAGLKVLAIDDERQILDLLGVIVSSLGAEYLRTLSVSEARRSIEDNGWPDLIFCDIMMPQESGLDFLQWVNQSGKKLPFYFITGISFDKAIPEGATEILQKPFTAKSVMQILKKVYKEKVDQAQQNN